MKNYYQILGVSKGSNNAIIKEAYRHNALLYHPDKNTSPEASTKFQLVSEAYSVLGDPYKRGRYDYEFEHQNSFTNPFNYSMNNAFNLFDSFFPDTINHAFNTQPRGLFRQYSFSEPTVFTNNQDSNNKGIYYSYSSQSSINQNGDKKVHESCIVNNNGNKNRYQTQYEIDSSGRKKNVRESGNRNLLGTGQYYKNNSSNKYLR
jgi:DnaJ-class molecular chaperone